MKHIFPLCIIGVVQEKSRDIYKLGSPRSVMAKKLDGDIVASEFKPQSRHQVHFRTNYKLNPSAPNMSYFWSTRNAVGTPCEISLSLHCRLYGREFKSRDYFKGTASVIDRLAWYIESVMILAGQAYWRFPPR